MAAITPQYETGPRTYAAFSAIAAGQLVIPHGGTASTIDPAGAAALNVVGVALNDAAPAGTDPATDLAARPVECVVAYNVDVLVTFAAAANFGDRLKAAASGKVTPMTLGTDADEQCIGTCTQPGGVAGGGTTKGLAHISPFGM